MITPMWSDRVSHAVFGVAPQWSPRDLCRWDEERPGVLSWCASDHFGKQNSRVSVEQIWTLIHLGNWVDQKDGALPSNQLDEHTRSRFKYKSVKCVPNCSHRPINSRSTPSRLKCGRPRSSVCLTKWNGRPLLITRPAKCMQPLKVFGSNRSSSLD